MSEPALIIDGAQAYGTPTLTITNPSGSGVAYKMNNINISRPIETAEDKGVTGLPARQRFTIAVPEFTGEAQLATDSTVLPVLGGTFSFTSDTVHGSENWCITQADDVRTNSPGDIRVVPITARRLINGTPPTVVTN